VAFVWQRSYDSGAAQSGSTATCALTGAVSGEEGLLSVLVSSNNRTISSFVDSASSTWTLVDQDNDGSNYKVLTYCCSNIKGAAPTVTVTFDTSAATGVYLWGDGYTNIGAVDVHDAEHNQNGSSVTVPALAADLTTTVAPALLYCAAVSNGVGGVARPITTPSGMTLRCDLAIGVNAHQRTSYELRLTTTGAQSMLLAVTGGNSSIIGVGLDVAEVAGGGMTLGPMFGG
jgi:hypothetical protein